MKDTNHEEVIKAAKLLREFCWKHMFCKDCPVNNGKPCMGLVEAPCTMLIEGRAVDGGTERFKII